MRSLVLTTQNSVNELQATLSIENNAIRKIEQFQSKNEQLVHIQMIMEDFDTQLQNTENWIINCRVHNCILSYDTR